MNPVTVRTGLKRVGIVFLCYLIFVQMFFLLHLTHGLARTLSRVVLLPAAVAQGKVLTYHEVVELEHGLEGMAGLDKHKEAFDQAVRTGVARLYIEKLAQELEVSVSQDELLAYPVDFSVLAVGLDKAGWNEREYRKYIVKPLLLAQKTEAALSSSTAYQTETMETMEALRRKLAQGMLIGDVAENFSEHSSATSRGDLGIMSLRDVPDWLLPATGLAPGEISGVIESADAFWTVEMIETFAAEPPENGAVHFRGLAVKKTTLGEVTDMQALLYPAFVFVW